MSFLNPNGLWFLLGIPVLIFLYILKQKYADRVISSSFIWRKSEHLIKKNIPWRRLLKYILFALQLLTVALISFVVARPVINTDSTGTAYYIIIDGSASMLAEADDKSRFDRTVDAVSDMAGEMPYGSEMTVILATESASCVVKSSDSENVINKALNGLECGFSDADIEAAVTLAQTDSAGSENAKIILYTDRDYDDTGDVLVVNMSDDEWNAAVTSLSADDDDDGTVFVSTVESYGADATLTLALYIDGTFVDAQFAECADGVPVDITWDSLDITSYSQVEVCFETDDAISIDNSYVLCAESESTKDVLIVSETSYFLENVLETAGDFNITTAKSLDTIPADEDDETGDSDLLSGYDLYIFDGVTPDSLPDDGPVWLINPDESSDETGLELGDAEAGTTLSVAGSSSLDAYTILTQNLEVDDIVVAEYTELLSFDDYETILLCGDSPVLLAKEDDDYIKTLVLMFDIHNSNLPLLIDFPLLVYNMIDYSLPSMLDDRDYTVGDTVYINALPGCSGISVEDEDGTEYEVELVSSTDVFTPEGTGCLQY